VEVTVFSDMYVQAAGMLKSDDPLLITGKLEKGEKGCKLLVMKPQEGNGRKFPSQVNVQMATSSCCRGPGAADHPRSA
jgi:DNA polymerase III subunit alpha